MKQIEFNFKEKTKDEILIEKWNWLILDHVDKETNLNLCKMLENQERDMKEHNYQMERKTRTGIIDWWGVEI